MRINLSNWRALVADGRGELYTYRKKCVIVTHSQGGATYDTETKGGAAVRESMSAGILVSVWQGEVKPKLLVSSTEAYLVPMQIAYSVDLLNRKNGVEVRLFNPDSEETHVRSLSVLPNPADVLLGYRLAKCLDLATDYRLDDIGPLVRAFAGVATDDDERAVLDWIGGDLFEAMKVATPPDFDWMLERLGNLKIEVDRESLFEAVLQGILPLTPALRRMGIVSPEVFEVRRRQATTYLRELMVHAKHYCEIHGVAPDSSFVTALQISASKIAVGYIKPIDCAVGLALIIAHEACDKAAALKVVMANSGVPDGLNDQMEQMSIARIEQVSRFLAQHFGFKPECSLGDDVRRAGVLEMCVRAYQDRLCQMLG